MEGRKHGKDNVSVTVSHLGFPSKQCELELPGHSLFCQREEKTVQFLRGVESLVLEKVTLKGRWSTVQQNPGGRREMWSVVSAGRYTGGIMTRKL